VKSFSASDLTLGRGSLPVRCSFWNSFVVKSVLFGKLISHIAAEEFIDRQH
jgi:hypothetical protein